jgi:hypothetical protein
VIIQNTDGISSCGSFHDDTNDLVIGLKLAISFLCRDKFGLKKGWNAVLGWASGKDVVNGDAVFGEVPGMS